MKFLLLALQYLPHVLAGVLAVENSLASTKGQNKKAVVLSAITAAEQVGASVPELHVQVVSKLIDGVVSTLNATGVFQHAPAA